MNRNYCQDHTAMVQAVEAKEVAQKDARKENMIAVLMACIVIGLPILGGIVCS